TGSEEAEKHGNRIGEGGVWRTRRRECNVGIGE
ncbi:hypothetical protein A2U01_0083793, partial [Trifolium medium]|nr:hypothetical protein [Trifolium medium]